MNDHKTDKRTVLKRIAIARRNVQQEMNAYAADGGMYARGLANEGRLGGYVNALDDVTAALTHGYVQNDAWEDKP